MERLRKLTGPVMHITHIKDKNIFQTSNADRLEYNLSTTLVSEALLTGNFCTQ